MEETRKQKTRKALVTGASQGIGRAIAVQLAQKGYDVVIHYHTNRADAEEVAAEVRTAGREAFLVQADLQDTLQAVVLGEKAWELAGGLDVVVNNAGVSGKSPFLEITEEQFDHFNQVNFRSTVFLTQTLARRMVEHKVAGSIWTITSVNGLRPGVGFSLYGATKGAVETLMKGAAMELAPYGIRVNTLAIGAVETEINRAVLDNSDLLQAINSGIPMGRFGLPEEIAAVLVDMVQSGSYMSGSTLVIDGGLLLMRGYGKPDKP